MTITEQLFINLQKYLFIQSFPTLHEEMVANLEKFIGNARSIGVVGALFFIIPVLLIRYPPRTFLAPLSAISAP
jgi:hypothetical protein